MENKGAEKETSRTFYPQVMGGAVGLNLVTFHLIGKWKQPLLRDKFVPVTSKLATFQKACPCYVLTLWKSCTPHSLSFADLTNGLA